MNRRNWLARAGLALVWGAAATVVVAQGPRSSLVQEDLPASQGQGLDLQQWSFTYNPPPPPPREIHKYDLVTIRVNELERMESEGRVQRRKNSNLDARLQNWLQIIDIDTVKPAPQADGDLRIRGQDNQIYRVQTDLETSKRLDLNIAATVADVRPNKTLVLEAHRQIIIDNEVWEYSLSGVCRAEDIGPDNVILSRNISELKIKKLEQGLVRDSYKRGVISRLLDRFNPF